MNREPQVCREPEAKGTPSSSIVPIAAALKNIRDRKVISFHALPLSNGASLKDCPLSQDYYDLFGDSLFKIEQTVSGDLFDSFFFPTGVIREAEGLAAETFGADGTLFVTSGTTVSNQIAIAALCRPRARVLADRQSHQSIHFPLKTLGAVVDYLCPCEACGDSGRSLWSLGDLIHRALDAEREGKPYELIVLNASSYDGVVYDIPLILDRLLGAGVSTRSFLVDEAWGIGNYFIEGMAAKTAMASRALLASYPDLVVVATQSAHKSIGTMRQASMLHYLGAAAGESLRNARFKIHTTSPNYPMLASLDLARAQMQASGRALFAGAVLNAAEFQRTLENDPGLSLYRINHFKRHGEGTDCSQGDPTKVSVNLSGTRRPPKDVRAELYTRHGIYVSRMTETSLLFNFHIGVSREMVDTLVLALKEIQGALALTEARIPDFIIPYPPGIPIAVPGDPMTSELRGLMKTVLESGNLLIRV
jgi:arginine/lysine/ornithine decarboxylase